LSLGVSCLVLLLTTLLIINGSYETRLSEGKVKPTPIDPSLPDKTGTIEGFIDSVNIAVSSQGFVIALFPIYSSMSQSAKPHIMKSVLFALIFTMSAYTYLGFVSIKYFGLTNVAPSILENIKQEEGFSPILLQFIFLIIFFCNTPFIFFVGKVAALAIVSRCCFASKERTSDEADDEFVSYDATSERVLS